LSEDFSNNNHGWALDSNESGAVRLQDGRLALAPNPQKCLVEEVPELAVGEDFYIESSITPSSDNAIMVGLGIGKPGAYHLFGLEEFYGWFSRVSESSANQPISRLPQAKPWKRGESFRFGLERIRGTYAFYANGKMVEALQLSVEGNNLALVTCTYGNTQYSYFDDITVRQTR
jgi:hypothetical protein